MSGTQTTLTISIVFIVLFSISIMAFAINFANDNDAYMSIADDKNNTYLYYSSASGNASEFTDDANSTYHSIKGTTVEPGSDVIQSAESFTITWSNAFSSFTNLLNIPRNAIFGGREGGFNFFFTALTGIILFLIGLYLIKTWRGNP